MNELVGDAPPLDIECHPAARAWAGTGAGGQVTGIDLLKEKRKTVAYRLRLDGGRSIIAKLQPIAIVERERAVYAGVLTHVELSAPDYLGSSTASSALLGWTFLADAGEERFALDDPEHRLLAAEWLARLHSQNSVPARTAARLTHRAAPDYLDKLVRARRRISEWHLAEGGDSARERLGGAVATLSRTEAGWAELASEWADQPAAIVHGDFAPRNIRIGRVGDRKRLLVFDWDMAAYAVAAVDLWWMASFPDAIEAYGDLVGPARPSVDARGVRRAAVFGAALQAIDFLDWDAWDPAQWAVACGWVEDLARALGELGLGPGSGAASSPAIP